MRAERVDEVSEFDVIVVGGGPAGATAACDLARQGVSVLLLERGFRIKPCGGAIPPRAVEQFAIAPEQLVARIDCARMISPANRRVNMPVGDSYVAMVDRERFDPYLRQRAVDAGATLHLGAFKSLEYLADGRVRLTFLDKSLDKSAGARGTLRRALARAVIGADGAKSRVARHCVPGADRLKCVLAYHEIVEAPGADSAADYAPTRCDVWYQGRLSPDFYAWVFPHGNGASIGAGSAHSAYSAPAAVAALRKDVGLDAAKPCVARAPPSP